MNSSKFNPGDCFEVIENGFQGKVTSVNMDVVAGKTTAITYEVMWSHEKHHNTHTYTASECDHLWEHSTEAKFYSHIPPYHLNRCEDYSFKLPEGYKIQDAIETTGCSHNFVPYQGLVECFEYCTKCDEKRYPK